MFREAASRRSEQSPQPNASTRRRAPPGPTGSPPGSCACTRTGPASPRARHDSGPGSPRHTQTYRRPSCRHCPRTCTTSTAFGWSAISSPETPTAERGCSPISAQGSAAPQLGRFRSGGHELHRPSGDRRDVVRHRGLEQATPRRHVRATAEQRTTLTLRHTAPDAPLDLVVERLGEALRAHRAPGAQLLGAVLRRASYEQLIRPRLVAERVAGPVLIPHQPLSLPRRAHLPAGHASQSPERKVKTKNLAKQTQSEQLVVVPSD